MSVSDRRADEVLSLLVVSLSALVLALLPSGLALAEVSRAWIWRGGTGVSQAQR